jgi:hypothetical protein
VNSRGDKNPQKHDRCFYGNSGHFFYKYIIFLKR